MKNRRPLSEEEKSIARVNLISEIEAKLALHNYYVERMLMPVSTLVSSLIPTIAYATLLGKEGALAHLFRSTQESYTSKELAAVSALTKSINMDETKLGLIVNEVVESLPLIIALRLAGDLSYHQLSFDEILKLQIDQTKQMKLPREILNNFKNKLADMLLSIIVLKRNELEKHRDLFATFEIEQKRKIAENKFEFVTVNAIPDYELFHKLSLDTIYKIISKAYKNVMAADFTKPDLKQHALQIGMNTTEKLFTSAFMALALFSQYTVISPIIKFSYYRTLNRNVLINPRLLANEDCEKFLKELNSDVQKKANFAKNMILAQRLLAGLLLIKAIYDLGNEEWHPEFLIFLVSSLMHIVKDIIQLSKETRYEANSKKRLQLATRTIKEAICLNTFDVILTLGKKEIESYLSFKAKNFHGLKAHTVNQIVKQVLFLNGFKIVSYARTGFSFIPKKLTAEEIMHIKASLEDNLNRRASINKLKTELTYLFSDKLTYQIFLDSMDLPTASFVIKEESAKHRDKLAGLFKNYCNVSSTDDYIEIIGHVVPENFSFTNFMPKQADESGITQTKLRSPICNQRKFFTKVKPTVENEKPEDKVAAETLHYAWPSGIYDSKNTNCRVKRIDDNVYGRNHFVLFNLKKNDFESKEAYDKFKTKIEEAELACSTRGHQGLEFRVETVHNASGGMFISHMRYKALGVFGDCRAYARKEVIVDSNNQEKNLYVFEGYDPHAHR